MINLGFAVLKKHDIIFTPKLDRRMIQLTFADLPAIFQSDMLGSTTTRPENISLAAPKERIDYTLVCGL